MTTATDTRLHAADLVHLSILVEAKMKEIDKEIDRFSTMTADCKETNIDCEWPEQMLAECEKDRQRFARINDLLERGGWADFYLTR